MRRRAATAAAVVFGCVLPRIHAVSSHQIFLKQKNAVVFRRVPPGWTVRGGGQQDAPVTAASSDDDDDVSEVVVAQQHNSIDHADVVTKGPRHHRALLREAVNGFSRTTSMGADMLRRRLEAIKEARINLKNMDRATLKKRAVEILGSVGPAAVDFLFPQDGKLTFAAVYTLTLLGSCSGFYLFLYFITVGYALGVSLPLAVAMVLCHTKAVEKVPFLTDLHSGLILVWGIRSAWFFLYREYINWPQLHEKVVQVNEMARMSSKIFCWIAYSLLYVTMLTPALSRLEQALMGKAKWGLLGLMGIGVQIVGLLVESIADHQKSAFKSLPGNRSEWCHVGLWKYSTHPNYLGEHLFWLGTFLAGVSSLHGTGQWISATTGLLFITIVLSGARSSLGSKHWRKYGTNEVFLEFRRTHCILGPIPWKRPPEKHVSVL